MWIIFGILLVGSFVNSSVYTTTVKPQKPHLILIVADDLGWNDVSWHNPGNIHMPYLDQLAKEGIILEESYVQPICTPTRSALLTGRYPFTLGRQHGVLKPLMPTGLTRNVTLLPEMLKDLGYSTHAIGKWHLGFCSWDYTPTKRGFDTFRGYYSGAEDYFKHTRNEEYHTSGQKTMAKGHDYRDNEKPYFGADGVYSTYDFAAHAHNLLSNRSPMDPLFLYMAFQSVHAPLQVPGNYTRFYKNIHTQSRRTYLGMVTAMDEAVGRIMEALKSTGHYNNSVIVFTTDNGGPTSHGANNWPLRGNKSTLWEGGTRGAAFIHSPLLPKLGSTSNLMIHATDWLATFVTLAGGKPPEGIDGLDQWGPLTGASPPGRREFVYNFDYTDQLRLGLRFGDYKLLVGNPGAGEWTPPPTLEEKTSQVNKILSSDGDDVQPRLNGSQSTSLHNETKSNADDSEVTVETQTINNNINKPFHSSDNKYGISHELSQLTEENEAFFDNSSALSEGQRPLSEKQNSPYKSVKNDDSIKSFESRYDFSNSSRESNSIFQFLQNQNESPVLSEAVTTSTEEPFVSDNSPRVSDGKNGLYGVILEKNVSPEIQKSKEEPRMQEENVGVSYILSEEKKADKAIMDRFKLLQRSPNVDEILEADIKIQLFNLKEDPEERHDISDTHRNHVKFMLARLLHYSSRVVAADIPPDDERADPKHWDGSWSPGWC